MSPVSPIFHIQTKSKDHSFTLLAKAVVLAKTQRKGIGPFPTGTYARVGAMMAP